MKNRIGWGLAVVTCYGLAVPQYGWGDGALYTLTIVIGIGWFCFIVKLIVRD